MRQLLNLLEEKLEIQEKKDWYRVSQIQLLENGAFQGSNFWVKINLNSEIKIIETMKLKIMKFWSQFETLKKI